MTDVVRYSAADTCEFDADVLIIGAGGCGLSAALAAADAGVEVVVLEQTRTPLGTTSMSTGLIPAAGTAEQAEAGIVDNPELFFRDIMAKNKSGADPHIVRTLCAQSSDTVAWLRDQHGVPLTLVDGFTYPGHSARRMYGTHNRTGEELVAALETAALAAGVVILTEAKAKTLYIDDEDVVRAVGYVRPNGRKEMIGCQALVLATCGFAANPDLIAKHIPEIEGAVPHTHPASQGLAISWGKRIGARLEDLSGYQGHAGLAAGHGIPILWPTIMEGGIQVNIEGRRFSNEARGYSEQAATVLAQPKHLAWTIFDKRIEAVMTQFNDYRDATSAGAILQASDIPELASAIGVDAGALEETLAEVEDTARRGEPDEFGRSFDVGKLLKPPYLAVKVTGAIFHTQGGLSVNSDGHVLAEDGTPFPNLFAGGGAARGISGAGADGYLAGNGLLTATSLGRIAGGQAARLVKARHDGG
jgi:fumarate reductase flavoprotein subunit